MPHRGIIQLISFLEIDMKTVAWSADRDLQLFESWNDSTTNGENLRNLIPPGAIFPDREHIDGESALTHLLAPHAEDYNLKEKRDHTRFGDRHTGEDSSPVFHSGLVLPGH